MQPVHSCACPDCGTNLAVIQQGIIISLPLPGGGYRDVCCYHIRCVKAMDEYTQFYIFEEHGREVIVSVVCKSLRTIEQQCIKGFVRVHKSYIVNILHVCCHYSTHLLLNNLPQLQIPIGDTNRDNFIAATEKWKIKKPVSIISP